MVNQDSSGLSRRQFLVWLGNMGLLAIVGALGREMLRYLTPPVTQSVPQPVKAGPPAKFAQNTLTFVPQAVTWLGRDEGGFFAISAVCTHLGCTLIQAGNAFDCPCHGSRFNKQGAVLNGPATAPMIYLAVRLEQGKLIIDPAQTVSPETRLAV